MTVTPPTGTAERLEEQGHALVEAGRLDEAEQLAGQMARDGHRRWPGFESRRRAAAGDRLGAMACAACCLIEHEATRWWSAGKLPALVEGEPWAVVALTVQVARVRVDEATATVTTHPVETFAFHLHVPASWLTEATLDAALVNTSLVEGARWASLEFRYGPGWNGNLWLPASWAVDHVLSPAEVAAAPWKQAKRPMSMAVAWSASPGFGNRLAEGI
ncbi:MAG: hypothetical protein EOO75_02705 [Myxococcales bacterium]|nr:MAG: hypothetical protein EOO75_02705 [Myxococcales bacterium]